MANIHEIVEKRRQRANLVSQMQEVLDRAKDEKRGLSAEENTQVDRIIADEEALTKEIRNLEWLEEKNQALSGHENRGAADDAEKRDKKEYKDVFKRWITDGVGSLDAEQRNLLLSNKSTEERALSSVTGAAGGFTVPQGFYAQIQEAVKSFGGMREVAFNLDTEGGNTLLIPTASDIANEGEIVAENGTVTQQDTTFGQLSLGAYKYSSKMILIPIELLQDSAFDIEAYIAKIIGTRIARITNKHFTVGTGTNQPQGIITAAATGKTGATGQTTSVTYDDLVDLEHSIDPILRKNAKFMFHDNTLRNIKKMKNSLGEPIWVPGVAYKEPDTVLSYNYEINQDMAQMAASAKSIAFGDLSSYWIRNVMNTTIVRFGEKFMDSGQIGFLAFARHDGKLIHGGTNPVAVYQNSAT